MVSRATKLKSLLILVKLVTRFVETMSRFIVTEAASSPGPGLPIGAFFCGGDGRFVRGRQCATIS